MDLDPDPVIFVIDLEDANRNKFVYNFSCSLLFEGTSFFKDKKSHKEVAK
jgi:hypothetical protein